MKISKIGDGILSYAAKGKITTLVNLTVCGTRGEEKFHQLLITQYPEMSRLNKTYSGGRRLGNIRFYKYEKLFVVDAFTQLLFAQPDGTVFVKGIDRCDNDGLGSRYDAFRMVCRKLNELASDDNRIVGIHMMPGSVSGYSMSVLRKIIEETLKDYKEVLLFHE